MPNRYDKVEFFKWDAESKTEKIVCTVSLVDKRLVYEGEAAQMVKDAIDENDYFKSFPNAGAYTMLSLMGHAFTGSYFYATDIIEASL